MKETHLNFAALCFMFVGFWPLDLKNRTLSFLYNGYFKFTVFYMTFFIVSLYIEWMNNTSLGMKYFVTHGTINLHFSFNVIQILSCRYSTSMLLTRKVEVTEKNILEKGTPEVKAVFLKKLESNKIFNIIFVMSALGVDFIYTITPFIVKFTNVGSSDDSSDELLPLEMWFPFDKFAYYKTSFIMEVIGGVVGTLYSIGSYYVYFGFMQFVITQFAILKHEIVTGVDGQLKEHEVQENIRRIVIFYNNIIEFVEQLNSVLSNLMLVAGAIFIEQIAILGFQVATDALSMDLFKAMMFFNALFIEFFLYYWLANEITLQNERVANAIWNSDWYNCSTSVKRSLVLVMIRSQRPLQLTMGPFYVMSNETMVQILKSGISYAAALRKFHMVKTESE